MCCLYQAQSTRITLKCPILLLPFHPVSQVIIISITRVTMYYYSLIHSVTVSPSVTIPASSHVRVAVITGSVGATSFLLIIALAVTTVGFLLKYNLKGIIISLSIFHMNYKWLFHNTGKCQKTLATSGYNMYVCVCVCVCVCLCVYITAIYNNYYHAASCILFRHCAKSLETR